MKQIQFNGNKNLISHQVRKNRKERGLSQTDLATRLQVLGLSIDQQAISKIEKNKRQVTDCELACLCKCLEVTPNDLLTDFFNEDT